MEALAKKPNDTIARPLPVLARLIQEDLKHAAAAAEKAGMPYFIAAGEKLLEAKIQLPHGEFIEWAVRHFSRTRGQLNYYMRLAQMSSTEDISSLGDLRRLTQPSYQPRPSHQAWHEPVKEVINRVDTETLNLRRDELKRSDERIAQRKLGLQLIDIGYKVLAKTLHPDKGGSRDAMARLNAVRDRLKQCV